MALGPFLQNLANQVGLSDTNDSNLIHRLDGEEGYRWTALALLYQIASGEGGPAAAVTIADGADVTLGAIADAAATAGGTGTISAKLREVTALLGGAARTFTSSAPTSGATIAAGAKSVGVVFSSDFAGTFNGAAASSTIYPGGKTISVINPNDTLPAIPYTISAGTMYLDVLT